MVKLSLKKIIKGRFKIEELIETDKVSLDEKDKTQFNAKHCLQDSTCINYLNYIESNKLNNKSDNIFNKGRFKITKHYNFKDNIIKENANEFQIFKEQIELTSKEKNLNNKNSNSIYCYINNLNYEDWKTLYQNFSFKTIELRGNKYKSKIEYLSIYNKDNINANNLKENCPLLYNYSNNYYKDFLYGHISKNNFNDNLNNLNSKDCLVSYFNVNSNNNNYIANFINNSNRNNNSNNLYKYQTYNKYAKDNILNILSKQNDKSIRINDSLNYTNCINSSSTKDNINNITKDE